MMVLANNGYYSSTIKPNKLYNFLDFNFLVPGIKRICSSVISSIKCVFFSLVIDLDEYLDLSAVLDVNSRLGC